MQPRSMVDRNVIGERWSSIKTKKSEKIDVTTAQWETCFGGSLVLADTLIEKSDRNVRVRHWWFRSQPVRHRRSKSMLTRELRLGWVGLTCVWVHFGHRFFTVINNVFTMLRICLIDCNGFHLEAIVLLLLLPFPFPFRARAGGAHWPIDVVLKQLLQQCTTARRPFVFVNQCRHPCNAYQTLVWATRARKREANAIGM